MSVNAPPLMLISRTPASKQLVADSNDQRVRNESFADADAMLTTGETRTSSETVAPSAPRAEFGAVSLDALDVTHTVPVPVCELVQPLGSAGAVTPSKFWANRGAQVSPEVQAFPSSQGFVLFV